MPRKPAASAPEPDPTPQPASAPADLPPSVPPAADVPGTEPAATTQPVPTAASSLPPSVLDRVRDNRMGPLAAALGVALLVALLLAVLVPNRPNLYAMTVLGLLLTAAVGFTVRYLSRERGLRAQAAALIATAIGLHVMGVTGTLDGAGSGERGMVSLLGIEGPGFDDALLGALATPAVSTGGVVCGLIAAIIVGWGPRSKS